MTLLDKWQLKQLLEIKVEKETKLEASPPGASCGESTSTENICETRTNQLVSPYNHHGNGHLSVLPQVTSRYISVLTSCMVGPSYPPALQPDQIYNQNIHDGLGLPHIKCESTFIHDFHREAGSILKNLENNGSGDPSPGQRMTIGKSSLSLTRVICQRHFPLYVYEHGL